MTLLRTKLPRIGRVREEPGEYRKRDTVQTRLNQRVAMGRLVVTPAALSLLRDLATGGRPYSVQRAADADPLALVLPYAGRHMVGEWGDVDESQAAANELALVTGEPLRSEYRLPNGDRVWVVTEADRSRTTVLLPSEY